MVKEKNFSHLGPNLTLSTETQKPVKKLYTDRLFQHTLDPSKEYIAKPVRKIEPHPAPNPIVGEPNKRSLHKGKKIVSPPKPASVNPAVVPPAVQARKAAIHKNIFSNVFEKRDDPLAVGIPRKKQGESNRPPVAQDIITYKGGPVYPPEVGIQDKVTSSKISEYKKIQGELIEQYKAEKSAYEVNRMKNCHSNWQGSKFQ